ncbi:MAG: hypothetical protein EXR03_10280 [Pseudolabrys sp.]|nr:hypothetical protein [Pseudolabrys sp.]MSP33184.1 hypothetical protein [Pseudolabrys sp.]
MHPNKIRADLWMDLALVAFLIGFDVAARLLPHAPGFMPVAASALFAGRMLRIPVLAMAVPLIAMALSNAALPGEDWRITLVVFAAISVPALVGILSRRWSGAIAIAAAMVSCSLFFFAVSNFAVWAFSGMYPLNLEGLTQCYVAALPFLDKTVMGDLFWTAVLFGGAWLMQHGPALARRAQ